MIAGEAADMISIVRLPLVCSMRLPEKGIGVITDGIPVDSVAWEEIGPDRLESAIPCSKMSTTRITQPITNTNNRILFIFSMPSLARPARFA
jgi:hypothetical protein